MARAVPTSRLAAGRMLPVARVGIVAWAGIGVALAAYAGWLLVSRMAVVVIVLAIAAVIVAILEPVVSRLESRPLPRWAAATLVYVGIFLPAIFALRGLGRLVVDQVAALAAQAPEVAGRVAVAGDEVWNWIAARGIRLPAPDASTWVAENQERIVDAAVGLARALTALAGALAIVLISAVIAFYALVALPRIRRAANAMIPPASGERVREGLKIVGGTITGFIRGQMLIALAVGVLSGTGLAILGVPYAALVGAIAGVTNLIPFFGPIVGSVPGVLLALGEGGVLLAVWTIVLFVVIQQFESYVLSPFIIGATVRLRPPGVMLAMLAGLGAAGIPGMLVAVPLAASMKALYLRFLGRRDEAAG